jgi:hypothetical protein
MSNSLSPIPRIGSGADHDHQCRIDALCGRQIDLRQRWAVQTILRHVSSNADDFVLLASITMRASVIESKIAERTRRLRFCNSIDPTRANLTAAIRPATTATVPSDLSDDPAAESGARKQSLSRYCRVS